jgi:hypothetical protein
MMFWLDDNGCIHWSAAILATSDRDALRDARMVLRPGEAAEVWLFRRMVGTVINDIGAVD